jgi:hypothetical protein
VQDLNCTGEQGRCAQPFDEEAVRCQVFSAASERVLKRREVVHPQRHRTVRPHTLEQLGTITGGLFGSGTGSAPAQLLQSLGRSSGGEVRAVVNADLQRLQMMKGLVDDAVIGHSPHRLLTVPAVRMR